MATHGTTTESAHEQQSPLVPLTLIGAGDASAGMCIDGVCILPGTQRKEDAD